MKELMLGIHVVYICEKVASCELIGRSIGPSIFIPEI